MALTTDAVYGNEDDAPRAELQASEQEREPVTAGTERPAATSVDEKLAALPQVGDEYAGGYVVKAVSTPEGLEVTLRVPDEDATRPVGVPQTVDPQAYVYDRPAGTAGVEGETEDPMDERPALPADADEDPGAVVEPAPADPEVDPNAEEPDDEEEDDDR